MDKLIEELEQYHIANGANPPWVDITEAFNDELYTAFGWNIGSVLKYRPKQSVIESDVGLITLRIVDEELPNGFRLTEVY